jgi:hypothetical protein
MANYWLDKVLIDEINDYLAGKNYPTGGVMSCEARKKLKNEILEEISKIGYNPRTMALGIGKFKDDPNSYHWFVFSLWKGKI